MKKLTLAVVGLIVSLYCFSQDIDIDKNSGLVKVDGKDAFYLIKKNKGPLGWADLSLQNLNMEELALFSEKKVEDLPYDERGSHVGAFYKVTFTATGNTARVFPEAFSGIKSMAKKIVHANLIKDNQVDPKAERSFVLANDGTIFREPNNKPVTVVVNTPVAATSANISLKENKIYNNDELIGSFKKTTGADNITTVSVYNKDDSKIATATHNDADANADWNITTASDNKTTQVLYNSTTPLEKLFKFLADKNYF